MNFGSRIVIETIPALSFRLLFMTRRVSSPETPCLATAFAHFLADASSERRDDFMLSATSFAVTFTSTEGISVTAGTVTSADSVATAVGATVSSAAELTSGLLTGLLFPVHPQIRTNAESSNINKIPNVLIIRIYCHAL